MRVEIIGNNYKAILSHEDLRKLYSAMLFMERFLTNTHLLERLIKDAPPESTINTTLISNQAQEKR